VVGGDVDPADDARGVDHGDGDHRERVGAVAVQGGQVDADGVHGSARVLGGRGEDAQGARDLVARVGEHGEGEVVLLGHRQRSVRLLRADSDQRDSAGVEFRDEICLVVPERDVAVRAPRAAVEHHNRGLAGAGGGQRGCLPVSVEQVTVRHRGTGLGGRFGHAGRVQHLLLGKQRG